MISTRTKIDFFYNLFVFTLICCFCKTISAFDSPYSKLPSTIFPTKYHLHISTLIHQNIPTYNGSVLIDLTIKEPTNEIVLNSNNLRQFKIALINIKNGLLFKSPQLEYKLDEAKEQLRIFWPQLTLKLRAGEQYRLQIDFVGDIQQKVLFGFYKSTYFNEKNNSVPIATTQFEPTSARLAFPCFDEPAFKANFVISITHGSNYSAISNMPADGHPVSSSTPNGEMVTTKFQATPKMSTYLVAFALTNFKNTSILVNGVEHRFFYPPNSKNNGSRALENAIKTIDALEKLLGIKYALPKLDHFEVKKLYGLAMENWGMLTFRSTCILSNQMVENKIKFFEMIRIQNHEIAHQWFGNLVTPASWNCLWLKEGFSTYFSYLAGNLVYPEEKMIEMFLTNEKLETYFILRPLTNVIEEGDNIKDNMDIVAYQLGAQFLRMFHHAIGHSTFMKGIFKYLSTFQYSVADEDDFFRAMQAAVDEDKVYLFQNNQSVANVMHTWTHNLGIPIVQIIRNYETGTITIQQKSNSDNQDQKWWIPMSFATAANPDFERTVADYIMPPQDEVTLDLKELNINLSNSDWLIVNKQQSGMFYVIYDERNLKLISEALIVNHKQIHVLNRALIFRDLKEMLEKELYTIETTLGLLQYLKFEKESFPWFNAYQIILNFLSILEDTKVSEKFRSFIDEITTGIYDKKFLRSLGDLTVTDLKVKNKIMKIKFQVDTITCQNFTTESAKDFFINGTAQIRKIKMPCKLSLCQSMKNATIQEFQTYLLRMVVLDIDSIEFYEFLNALNCVESKEIFKYLLDYIELKPNFDVLGLTNVLLLNKSFREWVLKYHFTKLKELDMLDMIEEKNNLMIWKIFWRKYEDNIYTWLENYEKKRELSF